MSPLAKHVDHMIILHCLASGGVTDCKYAKVNREAMESLRSTLSASELQKIRWLETMIAEIEKEESKQ